jgi:hypothetical protein
VIALNRLGVDLECKFERENKGDRGGHNGRQEERRGIEE